MLLALPMARVLLELPMGRVLLELPIDLSLKSIRSLIKHPGANTYTLEARKMALDVQGYLAHKKLPPPQDHHRALGMILL